jgi:hypothetical protein
MGEGQIICNRCGLLVSAGSCAPLPHVFHDRAEQCVIALRADIASARKLVAEMAVALAALGGWVSSDPDVQAILKAAKKGGT